MTLDDIFFQLSNGELSQLSIGTSNGGSIPTNQRKKVAASVQLGLNDLYKSFLIKEKSVQVDLVADQYEYELATLAPDLVGVERIEDSDGYEVPMNGLNNLLNVNLTTYNTMVIPSGTEYTHYTVVYRAAHPDIDMTAAETDPTTVDIELPPHFLNALLYFVGSRIHTPMATAELNVGTDYLMKYEAEKLRLKELNLSPDRVSDTSRFEANGWV